MARTQSTVRGVVPALTTPFKADQSLDLDAFAPQHHLDLVTDRYLGLRAHGVGGRSDPNQCGENQSHDGRIGNSTRYRKAPAARWLAGTRRRGLGGRG